jgi:hypothetical protein
VPTPKRFTQFGKNITSYYQIPKALISKTTCICNEFLHPGSQITFTRRCVRKRSAEIYHAYTEVVRMVRKKSLPHAFLTSYDIIQTIFSRKYSCEKHILAKIIPHVLKHPRMFVSQSTVLPTPKCTAQSGTSFTLLRQNTLDVYPQSLNR